MFSISKDGIVTLSRGDNISIPLFINAGTEISPVRYTLQDDDIVYLGICEPGQPFETAIVRKVYDKDNREINEHGDLVVTFNTKDTEHLENGLYYYIVKLRRLNDSGEEIIDTIIPKRKFYIED
jgi:hypothetical protein